ncbi:hypothetical protein [Rhizobium sullae]|uniref:hypothetical protein n=1 Tax=Rhizobium sullae TaxID=50338 RepID=UPI000B358B6B|nr:hypothetical protein [Rhizobium sullae]
MGKPVLTRGFYETFATELAKLLDEERALTNAAMERLESRMLAKLVTEVRVLRAQIAAVEKRRP